MPDPSNSPEAIAARNAFETANTPEERRTAAIRLIATMLGTARPNQPSVVPTGMSTLSPAAQAAWVTAADSHPEAVSRVNATMPILARPSNILGGYTPGLKLIELREQRAGGTPFSLPELVQTLYHELAHAVGAPDEVYGQNRRVPTVTAMDVTRAASGIHGDINLPIDNPANSALAILARSMGKKK